MPTTLDREDILRRNPGVDADELDATTRLRESIERQGGSRKSYELQPPFGAPRTEPSDDERDPRTVKLRGWRGL